ncbi:MAG: hypothetical protein MJZ38_00330 [archaeon]|nr:hypothetical protein [archaeon]
MSERSAEERIVLIKGCINEFIDTVYPCATDEDEYLIRRDTAVLFGKVMEMFGENPGEACIIADMAYGSMREMDGAASDVARDYLLDLIEITGIAPEEISEEDLRKGSLTIFGDEDAFVY